MHQTRSILTLENHPFFVGPVSSEDRADQPLTLPFALEVHKEYAVPFLVVTEATRKALSNAYKVGSMASTPLGDSSLSNVRMDEVLAKLLSLFDGKVEGVSFLEIGCGNGALLNEVKRAGGTVKGIEIGPQALEGARKFGIEMINRPLSKDLFEEKFDCIYSYGCLEHIIDLKEFFAASRGCLKKGGIFFHAVPNSELHFRQGAIDHLTHEHVNYFSPENGVRLLAYQGFSPGSVSISDVGNQLFLWGNYDDTVVPAWPGSQMNIFQDEVDKLSNYSEILIERTIRVKARLKKLESDGGCIGFYAGGFEYSLWLEDYKNARFFDTDSYKQGKAWLPGLLGIEAPQALADKPVDHLIVCRSHYFDEIKSYLINEVNVPHTIEIHNIASFRDEIR